MARRTRFIASLAAAAILLGGYTIYWWIVAGKLDQGIDDWAAAQRQAGLTLEFERTPVTGFPFTFHATFRHPRIAGALSGQRFDWTGPDVEADVSPIDLTRIHLHSPGHHVIDLGAGPATLDAQALEVRLGPGSAAATFAAVNVTLPDHRTIAAGAGTASLVLPPAPESDRSPLLQFALDATDLRLPEGTVLLTADPLGEARIAGTVKGPMPMAPLREALAAWRDAGGTVEVTDFAVAQATLAVSGSATVALDENLQPIVAANLKARGLSETLDLLASQRRLYPEDALKMKLFVKGAERDTKNGYKEVATGLTIQGGYLAWGPFKLARVPEIHWP
jgi:hypothetical protein